MSFWKSIVSFFTPEPFNPIPVTPQVCDHDGSSSCPLPVQKLEEAIRVKRKYTRRTPKPTPKPTPETVLGDNIYSFLYAVGRLTVGRIAQKFGVSPVEAVRAMESLGGAIVRYGNGTLESPYFWGLPVESQAPAPTETKPTNGRNTLLGYKRTYSRPWSETAALTVAYVKDHPGATNREIRAHLGYSSNDFGGSFLNKLKEIPGLSWTAQKGVDPGIPKLRYYMENNLTNA